MAKKFVEVKGLHNVFEVTGTSSLNTATLKSSVSATANSNSILFITADSSDASYGYTNGSRWIWTRGKLFNCNDTGGSGSSYSFVYGLSESSGSVAANLVSYIKNSSAAAKGSGNLYAVELDANGCLAVSVPSSGEIEGIYAYLADGTICDSNVVTEKIINDHGGFYGVYVATADLNSVDCAFVLEPQSSDFTNMVFSESGVDLGEDLVGFDPIQTLDVSKESSYNGYTNTKLLKNKDIGGDDISGYASNTKNEINEHEGFAQLSYGGSNDLKDSQAFVLAPYQLGECLRNYSAILNIFRVAEVWFRDVCGGTNPAKVGSCQPYKDLGSKMFDAFLSSTSKVAVITSGQYSSKDAIAYVGATGTMNFDKTTRAHSFRGYMLDSVQKKLLSVVTT